MPAWYARTLGQIVDDTLRLCVDFRGAGQDGRVWTRSEVIEAVNSVVLNQVKKTAPLKTSAIIQLQEGISVYDLPIDCILPLRFVFGSSSTVETLMTPKSRTEFDLVGQQLNMEGVPSSFTNEFVEVRKFVVSPAPQRGSLDVVVAEDGELVIVDDEYLISGQPPLLDNVKVYYVRSPSLLSNESSYPDSAFPEFAHHWIKYGAAQELMRHSRKPLHQKKSVVFYKKWIAASMRLSSIMVKSGPMDDLRPL